MNDNTQLLAACGMLDSIIAECEKVERAQAGKVMGAVTGLIKTIHKAKSLRIDLSGAVEDITRRKEAARLGCCGDCEGC